MCRSSSSAKIGTRGYTEVRYRCAHYTLLCIYTAVRVFGFLTVRRYHHVTANQFALIAIFRIVVSYRGAAAMKRLYLSCHFITVCELSGLI